MSNEELKGSLVFIAVASFLLVSICVYCLWYFKKS